MRLPLGATAAEAISWLVGNVVPIKTDLSGRLAGWYRLSKSQDLVPPASTMSTLDTDMVFTLKFIPNHQVYADIEVLGAATPIRFVSPVGTAVPVVSLVDHLAAWLNLDAGDWRLSAGGRPLDSHAILSDLQPNAGLLSLQLARGGGQSSRTARGGEPKP